MSFNSLVERADARQREEDIGALSDEETKLGEGANTSAHLSPRGYVVKPKAYDWKSEDPFEQAETVEDIGRFPWIEIEEREVDSPFNHAMVKMDKSDFEHNQAVEAFHVRDVIWRDLDMFAALRSEGITYADLKPDNIGYFEENGELVAKPIDVIDGYAWKQEGELDTQRFSDIVDVYLTGTPQDSGFTDEYNLTVPEAEQHVMSYLGCGTENITGEPHRDIAAALEESGKTPDDILNS